MSKIKRLFFDIETSYCIGWFWKPGYKLNISYDQVIDQAAIICICYKWEGEKKIHSLEWKRGNDKSMIQEFTKIIQDADEVVGHNGDNFDLKWFRTRCLFHGAKSLPEFKTIDTLKISRAKFKFPSNRLDAIGKYLGLGGKEDTGGVDLWHDVIRKNCPRAMAKMVKYCKRDVGLLEDVYLKLSGFAPVKTNIAAFCGNDRANCHHCGSINTRLGRRLVSAAGLVRIQLQCNDCHKYYTTSLKAYNDLQASKRKESFILKRH